MMSKTPPCAKRKYRLDRGHPPLDLILLPWERATTFSTFNIVSPRRPRHELTVQLAIHQDARRARLGEYLSPRLARCARGAHGERGEGESGVDQAGGGDAWDGRGVEEGGESVFARPTAPKRPIECDRRAVGDMVHQGISWHPASWFARSHWHTGGACWLGTCDLCSIAHETLWTDMQGRKAKQGHDLLRSQLIGSTVLPRSEQKSPGIDPLAKAQGGDASAAPGESVERTEHVEF